MKTVEQAIYTAFKQCLNYPLYYGLADENQDLPYLNMYEVSNIEAREVSATRCHIRLDVFEANRVKAWELAEDIIDIINHKSFIVDQWIIEKINASKQQVMSFEDGTCKVPIEIRFSAMRKRS